MIQCHIFFLWLIWSERGKTTNQKQMILESNVGPSEMCLERFSKKRRINPRMYAHWRQQWSSEGFYWFKRRWRSFFRLSFTWIFGGEWARGSRLECVPISWLRSGIAHRRPQRPSRRRTLRTHSSLAQVCVRMHLSNERTRAQRRETKPTKMKTKHKSTQ